MSNESRNTEPDQNKQDELTESDLDTVSGGKGTVPRNGTPKGPTGNNGPTVVTPNGPFKN